MKILPIFANSPTNRSNHTPFSLFGHLALPQQRIHCIATSARNNEEDIDAHIDKLERPGSHSRSRDNDKYRQEHSERHNKRRKPHPQTTHYHHRKGHLNNRENRKCQGRTIEKQSRVSVNYLVVGLQLANIMQQNHATNKQSQVE